MSPHRWQRALALWSCMRLDKGSLRRRLRRSARAAVLMLLAASLLGPLAPSAPARAIQGNPSGGLGRYQQEIDWIDWTEGRTAVLSRGGTFARWSTPTMVSSNPATWRSSRCVVSKPSGDLALGYIPGSWRGDGLARLYNDGSTYSGGASTGHTRSGLPIGISNPRNASVASPLTVTFTVSCSTYLIFSASRPAQGAIDSLPKQEIPMAGMVVADAESSTWDSGKGSGESITIHADSGRYRLLESARDPQCTTNSRGEENTFLDSDGVNRTGLRLRSDGNQCSSQHRAGWGPVSVLFVEGSSSVNAQIVATGKSAVAFGVVGYSDFGDAPESYGAAGSVFQPTWSGGLVGIDIRRSWEGWIRTSYNLTEASNSGQDAVAGPPATRLGATTDSETSIRHSPDATGDDQDAGTVGNAGVSDEDALVSPVQVRANQGQSFRQEVACTGPGQVRGWIDWNRDGVFDPATEASTQVDCAGGLAAPEWQVPLNAIRSVVGESGSANTFMRLRISNDRDTGGALKPLEPTGITGSGEVEDYTVSVFLPALTLVKTVDATWAGSSILEPSHWELSATSTTDPDAGPVLSGAGGAEQALVLPGSYNLAEVETASNPASAGYQPQGWSCYETPGTVVPDGYTYTSSNGPVSQAGQTTGTVEIKNQDRVTCEIINRAVPGNLTWTKTDAEGTLLGGSQWGLMPVDPQGDALHVTDCVGTCQAGSLDTDPAEGVFRVSSLVWGTYSLTEMVAPTGYNQSTETWQAVVGGQTPGLTADLGRIVNERITGTVSWTKTDEIWDPLGGSEWTLTPVDPQGEPIRIADCTGTCHQDSRDTNPEAGAITVAELPYGTYSLVETTAPAGYRLDDTPREVNVASHGQVIDLGRIVNERITGTVTWRKTDEGAAPLSGSQWRLTSSGPQGNSVTITDCVLHCAEDSLDTNPEAGAFTVPGLPHGTYTLVETTAPAGYRLDDTPHEISVTTHGETVDLGDIVNRKTLVPGIPLTGGRGADLFIIAGAGISALAAMAALVRRRRRRSRD